MSNLLYYYIQVLFRYSICFSKLPYLITIYQNTTYRNIEICRVVDGKFYTIYYNNGLENEFFYISTYHFNFEEY